MSLVSKMLKMDFKHHADAYDALGIPTSLPGSALPKARFKRIQEIRLDPATENADAKIAEVERAYKILSTPNDREMYDSVLAGEKVQPKVNISGSEATGLDAPNVLKLPNAAAPKPSLGMGKWIEKMGARAHENLFKPTVGAMFRQCVVGMGLITTIDGVIHTVAPKKQAALAEGQPVTDNGHADRMRGLRDIAIGLGIGAGAALI